MRPSWPAPLTDPVVDALHDAGLFGLMVPAALGGHEASILTCIEIFEELARADGSTGWSYMAERDGRVVRRVVHGRQRGADHVRDRERPDARVRRDVRTGRLGRAGRRRVCGQRSVRLRERERVRDVDQRRNARRPRRCVRGRRERTPRDPRRLRSRASTSSSSGTGTSSVSRERGATTTRSRTSTSTPSSPSLSSRPSPIAGGRCTGSASWGSRRRGTPASRWASRSAARGAGAHRRRKVADGGDARVRAAAVPARPRVPRCCAALGARAGVRRVRWRRGRSGRRP